MSKLLKLQTIKLAVISLVLGIAISGMISASHAATSLQDLPEGKGVEAVRDKCLICHEADLITQQRLNRAGWVREVDKMIRWGAKVSEAEKEPMIDYLAERFGQRPAAQTGPVSQAGPASQTGNAQRAAASAIEVGQQVFENQCLICHEADLTKQQRLTRAGWVREVDKMIRWGAKVSDAEKEALIDYLSKNFGPLGKP